MAGSGSSEPPPIDETMTAVVDAPAPALLLPPCMLAPPFLVADVGFGCIPIGPLVLPGACASLRSDVCGRIVPAAVPGCVIVGRITPTTLLDGQQRTSFGSAQHSFDVKAASTHSLSSFAQMPVAKIVPDPAEADHFPFCIATHKSRQSLR